MPNDAKNEIIAVPGGEIVLQSDRDRTIYNEWDYAPARRAGDSVYVSGVIVARLPEGPHSPETFKVAMRQGFQTVRAQLRLYDADFSDIVMINTFHDWSAPEFDGNPLAQAEAFKAVKAEFIRAPHPAWTAVGTTGLVRPTGILEIQVIAYSPRDRS